MYGAHIIKLFVILSITIINNTNRQIWINGMIKEFTSLKIFQTILISNNKNHFQNEIINEIA